MGEGANSKKTKMSLNLYNACKFIKLKNLLPQTKYDFNRLSFLYASLSLTILESCDSQKKYLNHGS